MGFREKIRRFCPQPPKQFPKLKRHFAPVAIALTVILVAIPFSLLSFNYLAQPSLHPVPVNAPLFQNSTLHSNSNLASTTTQVGANVIINADGSVTGTNIERNGDVYVLTGNISGGIQVQKSYVTIDGAGYTVNGNGQGTGVDLGNGVGQNPSHASVSNVTVTNLKIINCYYAIGNENTYNNTFIGNYIEDCDTGFWITGSANNTLIHNTVKNCTTGISINYGSGTNIIVENNILSSWSVWLSPDPVADRNYWGDYTTRFPNAKEIGNSGVWDTPYSHGDKVIDYHPLVNPVDISSNESSAVISSDQTTNPSPEAPEFSAWIILVIFVAIFACAAVWKTRIPNKTSGLSTSQP